MTSIVPIVLSGGAGSRLWPVSREAAPKPFMKLGGDASLLQRTLRRAAPLATGGRIGIVTNKEYLFPTRDEIAGLGLKTPVAITQLLEPVGRNTAPAIAAAALWALQGDADAIMLILPADHLIPDEAAFQRAARDAASAAVDGSFVLFGIRPTGPETGFGYIEADLTGATPIAAAGSPPSDIAIAALPVRRFVEKPPAAQAMQFLQAGNFYWNSGMFCFRADALLEAMGKHAPDVLKSVQAAWEATPDKADVVKVTLDADKFGRCPDISIDYAVMEHAESVRMLPTSFAWSDIGSWKAVSEQLPADEQGNTTIGETMLIDTRNTHIQSDARLVAAIGVDDLLVIDTPDALLVAAKSASQQVKEIVSRLKLDGHETATLHRTVARPWGTYTTLNEGSRFKIKRIEVKPGQSLSLQMHHHRSEHWIVVQGTARVTCGDSTTLVATNESTYIPVGTRHRLENPGVINLAIIEVQCGDYLGEDDIVRFSDVYGRVAG